MFFLNYSLPVGRRIFNGKYLFSQSTFYTDVTLDSTLTVRRIFWIILRHVTKSYNNNVVCEFFEALLGNNISICDLTHYKLRPK